MTDPGGFLAGVTAADVDSESMLKQIGITLRARHPTLCSPCGEIILEGSPIMRCQKYGWCHAVCLKREQDKAERRRSVNVDALAEDIVRAALDWADGDPAQLRQAEQIFSRTPTLGRVS